MQNFEKWRLNPNMGAFKALKYEENKLEIGSYYIVLGFTGMQDGIVFVNKDGKIVEMEYFPADWTR